MDWIYIKKSLVLQSLKRKGIQGGSGSPAQMPKGERAASGLPLRSTPLGCPCNPPAFMKGVPSATSAFYLQKGWCSPVSIKHLTENPWFFMVRQSMWNLHRSCSLTMPLNSPLFEPTDPCGCDRLEFSRHDVFWTRKALLLLPLE